MRKLKNILFTKTTILKILNAAYFTLDNPKEHIFKFFSGTP